MTGPLERVMDALDIETFIVCGSEDEGRKYLLAIMKDMGFRDVDVVFAQYEGPGVRVRGRAYVYRPADRYHWLLTAREAGE